MLFQEVAEGEDRVAHRLGKSLLWLLDRAQVFDLYRPVAVGENEEGCPGSVWDVGGHPPLSRGLHALYTIKAQPKEVADLFAHLSRRVHIERARARSTKRLLSRSKR